jgi:hypothetical protein
MAVSRKVRLSDEIRQKIQAGEIINRLMEHIQSDTPLMNTSQVTAATKLLSKVLPDLANVALTGEGNEGPAEIVFKTVYEPRPAACR